MPILFPMVRYDGNGLPVTVTTPEALKALPANFAPVPTVVAAIQAFPPAVVATALSAPLALAIAPPLATLIALNVPKVVGRKNRGEN